MNQFGKVPWIVSCLLMLLLATYLGTFWGMYAWGCHQLSQRGSRWLWLGAPSIWVSLEYLRTYALSGFPWALLGYSQYQWLPIIQVSDLTGVYGVSFLLIMSNVAAASMTKWIWDQKAWHLASCPWQPTVGFLIILSAALGYGHWQMNRQAIIDQSAKSLDIGLVQPNILQDKKWDPAYIDETLTRFTTLSQEAGKDLDLLIWPEAATPFFFEQEKSYQQVILSLLQQTQSPLLFGSPTLRFETDGSPYLLNSAYVIAPDELITGRYDKRHLVPFGEYIPFKSLLFFLEKLVVGIGDFKPGQGPMTLSFSDTPENVQPFFAVPICYEIIFPNLVRLMAKEGAHFIATITNDAWFGDSAAPHQHFSMAVFRAVENHLAIARAANTGVSGFIGPDGRILAKTPTFTQQALASSIPLRSASRTFYTEYGDVFSWGCVILGGFLLLSCYTTKPMSKDNKMTDNQA